MFDNYVQRRVEGAKTLGDAYDHVKRDHAAFVAGVQYALDSLLHNEFFVGHGQFGVCLSDTLAEAVAISILERAKNGEPQ